MTVRQALVRLHRWVGLGIAGFLIVVGLTGAAIAWNDEGERLFAPSLFVLSPARAARRPLDPFSLREAAEKAAPGFAINNLEFTRERDEPARFGVEARPGGPDPANDEIALDPSTGRLLGARRHGALSQGWINTMPFIYDLHDQLALGDGGTLVLGIVALAWTLDCFVGLWLTFPVRAAPRRSPGYWSAVWSRAWRIRRPARGFKLTFDLHSAGGLWMWPMLFVIAWSAVAFNLPGVYGPVTHAVLGIERPVAVPARGDERTAAAIGWRRAHAIAVTDMAAEAARHGFAVRGERLMMYDPAKRTYVYRVRSSLDPGKLGNTQLVLDADTGRVLDVQRPTGGKLGATVTTWIENLHEAQVLGWPMQALLTMVGVGVAMLSITGVLIWWRKRAARTSS